MDMHNVTKSNYVVTFTSFTNRDTKNSRQLQYIKNKYINFKFNTTDTLVTALVNRPVIFLQMLAASAVDDGASSLITVFSPRKSHILSRIIP